MEGQVTLTAEERLQELSDGLLCSIIGNSDLHKSNRRIVFGQLSPKVFRDENYIIYAVFNNFKDKNITPDEDFMKMYLMRNTKFVKESQDFIDINAYSDLDENPLVGYIAAVLKQFKRLLGLTPVDPETLELNIEKFKQEYCAIEANRALSQCKLMLYDGVTVGNKLYQGYGDSVAYFKNCIAKIESVLDHTTGAGFVDSSVEGLVDDDDFNPEKIGDFGLIKELNERLGGYFTGVFYNILAPTKGGKSKFTSRGIHSIVVENGNNVSVWAVEGGHKAWWAQMRAIHYEYMYIRGKEPHERPVALSQKDILYGNYPSEAVRQLEMASRQDLFTNPAYGNIMMIDRPFYAETFIDEIETSVQLNNSKAVLIDYLQLITSKDSSRAKSQVIGRAYQDLLSYCKKRNVMVISPSQFTQDFMNEMAKSKEGQSHEVRTAGGESAEIIRTPDINIALYANTEDLIRKEMTIMSVPSRLCEPFPDIKIYADLCSCVFASISDDE